MLSPNPVFARRILLAFSSCTWPLCIKPCSPKISLLHLTHCLHLRAHWIWKLLWRWPSSASVPYSFSLFFKTRKRTLSFHCQGDTHNISPCILHPLLLFLSGISTWIYPFFTWTMKSSHFSPLLYNLYKLILLTLTCTINITFKTENLLTPSTLLLVAFSFFSFHLQQKFTIHAHSLSPCPRFKFSYLPRLTPATVQSIPLNLLIKLPNNLLIPNLHCLLIQSPSLCDSSATFSIVNDSFLQNS